MFERQFEKLMALLKGGIKFSGSSPDVNPGSAGSAAAIVPNDAVDLANVTRGIYVGGAGNLKVDMVDGTVTFIGIPAGAVLPVRVKRIYVTGTTATNLVALW